MHKKKTNKLMLLWYSHPRVAIAVSLIAINLAVIVLFTGLLSIVSGNPFFDELAYIFTYTMCSDGIYDFVNSQEDMACFVIKMVLTVIQMVIFSGALIGFTTDILQSMIDKRLNNLGKIKLADHYVFLNWSSIGAHLIYDLSFLEGKKNIVILSEQDREEVLNSIQNIFTENRRKMKDIRLFIKSGNPNSPKYLEDISLRSAKYVGVLLSTLENDGTHAMSTKDIQALKSLFTIIHAATQANIVVEVENNDTVVKIEKLLSTIDKDLHNRIIIFSHNSVLGHILGKTIVSSGFSGLYHSLLSYDGCEFYGIPTMDMEEALRTYSNCIPVINYDDDDAVDGEGKKRADQLYVLAENGQDLGVRETKRSYDRTLNYRYQPEREEFSVFILSRSGDSKFVVDELDQYENLYQKKIACYAYSYHDDLEEVIARIKETKGKKKILLLSSDGTDMNNQDEDIFLSALTFKLSGCLDDTTEILAEIMNPANLSCLKNFGVMSVIVSNRILSLFMVQLLTHPGSRKFYRDLISTNELGGDGAIDLDIVKVSEVLTMEEPTVEFACRAELVQSFYLASNKTRLCIGIKRVDDPEITFLCSDMDKEEQLVLTSDDELILINY